MSEKKELEWGQTPFDELSGEELLMWVWRLFSAVRSAGSVMAIVKESSPQPFWGMEGSGGKALEKARQCIEPVLEQYDSESIYRSFFRYADDLLFEKTGHRIGSGWAVCPECGIMFGAKLNGETSFGQVCGEYYPDRTGNCTGVLRPLQWGDLRSDVPNQ